MQNTWYIYLFYKHTTSQGYTLTSKDYNLFKIYFCKTLQLCWNSFLPKPSQCTATFKRGKLLKSLTLKLTFVILSVDYSTMFFLVVFLGITRLVSVLNSRGAVMLWGRKWVFPVSCELGVMERRHRDACIWGNVSGRSSATALSCNSYWSIIDPPIFRERERNCQHASEEALK